MDDTDAVELIGREAFVRALLRGGPLVVPDDLDPGPTADDPDTSRTS